MRIAEDDMRVWIERNRIESLEPTTATPPPSGKRGVLGDLLRESDAG